MPTLTKERTKVVSPARTTTTSPTSSSKRHSASKQSSTSWAPILGLGAAVLGVAALVVGGGESPEPSFDQRWGAVFSALPSEVGRHLQNLMKASSEITFDKENYTLYPHPLWTEVLEFLEKYNKMEGIRHNNECLTNIFKKHGVELEKPLSVVEPGVLEPGVVYRALNSAAPGETVWLERLPTVHVDEKPISHRLSAQARESFKATGRWPHELVVSQAEMDQLKRELTKGEHFIGKTVDVVNPPEILVMGIPVRVAPIPSSKPRTIEQLNNYINEEVSMCLNEGVAEPLKEILKYKLNGWPSADVKHLHDLIHKRINAEIFEKVRVAIMSAYMRDGKMPEAYWVSPEYYVAIKCHMIDTDMNPHMLMTPEIRIVGVLIGVLGIDQTFSGMSDVPVVI